MGRRVSARALQAVRRPPRSQLTAQPSTPTTGTRTMTSVQTIFTASLRRRSRQTCTSASTSRVSSSTSTSTWAPARFSNTSSSFVVGGPTLGRAPCRSRPPRGRPHSPWSASTRLERWSRARSAASSPAGNRSPGSNARSTPSPSPAPGIGAGPGTRWSSRSPTPRTCSAPTPPRSQPARRWRDGSASPCGVPSARPGPSSCRPRHRRRAERAAPALPRGALLAGRRHDALAGAAVGARARRRSVRRPAGDVRVGAAPDVIRRSTSVLRCADPAVGRGAL